MLTVDMEKDVMEAKRDKCTLGHGTYMKNYHHKWFNIRKTQAFYD
jgi:hypothetical protein